MRTALLLLMLSLVGCAGDDGTSESGASTSGSDATTGTTSSDTASQTSTPAESSTSADDTTSGPRSVMELCVLACMRMAECGIDDQLECTSFCAPIENLVMGCEETYVTQMECVVVLPCEEFQSWFDGGSDHGCTVEEEAHDACIPAGGLHGGSPARP